MNRKTLALCIAGLGFTAAAAAAATAGERTGWVGAYGNPPIGYEPAIKDALGTPLHDQTVRQIVRVGTAGSTIRLRFSNELGTVALRLGAVSFVQLDASGAPVAGTQRPVLFAGASSVVIPAGAPMLADPLAVSVAPGVDYAVLVYFPETVMPPAHAQMADIAPGDQTTAPALANSVHRRVPAILSRIDVVPAVASRTLVAFGDSITEGAASTPGKYMSWPDQLARAFGGTRTGRCWSVVNTGISGNRLLSQGRGPNALARFDRDVLSVPGVRTVVVLEGINDIGASAMPEHRDQAVSADRIIGAYREIIARAHAHGIRVIGGTLLPYEGAAYFSTDGEAKRQAANAFIRSSGAFDGVIDFDLAMRDPAHPTHMTAAAESTDSLHPHDAGYTIMARTALATLAHDGCDKP